MRRLAQSYHRMKASAGSITADFQEQLREGQGCATLLDKKPQKPSQATWFKGLFEAVHLKSFEFGFVLTCLRSHADIFAVKAAHYRGKANI